MGSVFLGSGIAMAVTSVQTGRMNFTVRPVSRSLYLLYFVLLRF